MYERFSPEFLNKCININENNVNIENKIYSKLIFDTVLDINNNNKNNNDKSWNQVVKEFSLPIGFELILCDVQGGSSSTAMVFFFMYVY